MSTIMISIWIIVGTCIRLLIQLACSSSSINVVNATKSIQASLIDPQYSFRYFLETCHLARLYQDGMLTLPISSTQFDSMPVTLLSLFDRLLMSTSKLVSLDSIFGMLTTLIDLLTAIQLLRLVRNVMDDCDSPDKEWEQSLEKQMNPLIHAEYAWIFGENFGCDFKAKHVRNQIPKEPQDIKVPILKTSNLPSTCFILYFMNPITILATSMYPSFQGLQYFCLLTIFERLTSPKTTKAEGIVQTNVLIQSTSLLSLLAYFDFHYMIFLSPTIIWCTRNFCGSKTHMGSK